MCDLNYFFRSPGEQDCWSFWHSWMLDYDTEAIVDSQKENNLFFCKFALAVKAKFEIVLWHPLHLHFCSLCLQSEQERIWVRLSLKTAKVALCPALQPGLGARATEGRQWRETTERGGPREGGAGPGRERARGFKALPPHPLPSPGPSCATDRFPAVLCAGMSFTNHDCFVGWVSRPPSVPSNMADASWVPKSWGMKEWWKFLGRHFCYIFFYSILAKVDNTC